MKRFFNTMSGRICLIVIIGMTLSAFLIITAIIRISENIFINTYGKAQEQVFLQVETNFNDYYERLTKVMNEVDNSWSFRMYTRYNEEEGKMNSVEQFNVIYQLQRDLETSVTKYMSQQNLLIVGQNGVTYLNRDEMLTTTADEILMDSITREAAKNPNSLHFYFREKGFSQTTNKGNVLMGVQAFQLGSETEPYAYAYVTLTEQDIKEFYNFFVTDMTDFYLINENNEIIVSNKERYQGKECDMVWKDFKSAEDKSWDIYRSGNDILTVYERELPYFQFSIYGVIDNNEALGRLYDTRKILWLCIFIVGAVVGLTIIVIQRSMKPLRVMTDKMSSVKTGKLDAYMTIRGTEEIRKLTTTYNDMLDDIQNYVDEIMKVQHEKRKAEIRALQMQINPHYVYNTLASIKWLIWQGDTEKSSKTIDAFIYLLRNTISNTSEFITVEQERENLKNYIWINNTRYGDQVKTEFFVLQECEQDLLPKMILQPFVENAFFHAFPSGKAGTIQIFIREKGEALVIEIKDDGVGMKEEDLNTMFDKRDHEAFSGIGINNVNDRLHLLYGQDYGTQISSEIGVGTTVTIRLPIQKKTQENQVGNNQGI